MNEVLIKDGKSFNLETSTLIAVSQWFTYYDTKRYKIYQTKKGTFFKVVEIGSDGKNGSLLTNDGYYVGLGSVSASKYSLSTKDGGYRDDIVLKAIQVTDVRSEKQIRDMLEYTLKGGVYAMSNDASASYKFLKTYEELFSLEEM